MAKVLSSISGNLISAASAGFAPTNSADVSAIASAYQVVSATATQLYAGTAHVTSINGDPISASRAGNAANASLATSAYYDGTGRLISALPDSATVSSIASSYAESAASSKADSSALSSYALSADVSGVIDTVSANSASWGGGATGDYVENSALDSATVRSSTGALLPQVTGVSSISGKPLIPKLLTQPTMQYGGESTFVYMPDTSIWSTAYEATGVFSPLQYATGACLAMDAGNFKAYYKGNEWFVSNTATNGGMLRGEIHASRGIRVVGSAKNSARGFQLHPSGVNGVSSSKTWGLKPECVSGIGGNGTAWQYGTAENIMLTSVHDTVSANSASWGGGGGGSYVETSAMEVEIGSSNTASSIGFAQGSSNSARNTAFAQGRGNNIAYTSFGQGVLNAAYSCSFAQGTNNTADIFALAQGELNQASSTSFSQGSFNSAGSTSFAQGNGNVASSCSFAQGIINTAYDTSFTHGYGNSAINKAVVFGEYNLSGDGDTASGNSAAFAIGDGTAHNARHDLMLVTKDGEITMYSSTADTTGTGIMSAIRAISAAATGGVDSATVSSIASSYAESAASSKMDTSAMTSYALSADVSGTVDLVSTQSANWGGSALALSAGPGVKLEKVGNTLVASTDETVLWSGSATAATLTESVTNFEYIEIYATRVGTNRHAYAKCPGSATQIDAFNAYGGNLESHTGWFGISNGTFNLSGTGISALPGYQISFFTSGNFRYQTIGNYMSIMKVVGINRTAGV